MLRRGIFWLLLLVLLVGGGIYFWQRHTAETGGEAGPNGNAVEGVDKEGTGSNDETENPGDEKGKNSAVVPEEPELPGAVLAMVDNMKNARPQSGLNQADLVYEIIAEGGITRFMALFYRQQVEEIGPIRSARNYFVKLAHGYDAPLAHAGGSGEALNLIATLKAKDLDEIYNSGGYFWRDKSRKAPHNLYSSTEKLLTGAKKRGYQVEPPELSPIGTSWEGTPFTEPITLDYSVAKYKYKVTWRYDEKDNRYVREINGKPHLMKNDASITADNVVVLVVKTKTYVKDGIPLSDVQIVGSGEALYYVNGQKMAGTWEKQANSAPIRFFDGQKSFMKLKEGNTWVQVIPSWNSLEE